MLLIQKNLQIIQFKKINKDYKYSQSCQKSYHNSLNNTLILLYIHIFCWMVVLRRIGVILEHNFCLRSHFMKCLKPNKYHYNV